MAQTLTELLDYLTPYRPDLAWLSQAACRGSDPEMFVLGDPRNDEAKEICSGCPVRSECWQDAASNGLGGLIFAGSEQLKEPKIKRSPTIHNKDKKFCKNDHEFTFENTYRSPRGRRECLTCRRKATATYRKTHKRTDTKRTI